MIALTRRVFFFALWLFLKHSQRSAYLHIFAHVSTLLSAGILYLSTANFHPGYLPGILKIGGRKDPAREMQGKPSKLEQGN